MIAFSVTFFCIHLYDGEFLLNYVDNNALKSVDHNIF